MLEIKLSPCIVCLASRILFLYKEDFLKTRRYSKKLQVHWLVGKQAHCNNYRTVSEGGAFLSLLICSASLPPPPPPPPSHTKKRKVLWIIGKLGLFVSFSPHLLCSFAALFSPAKRRQLEQNLAEPPRRSILSRRSPAAGGTDEDDGGFPQAGAAGYRNTKIIPVLRKTGKRQGEDLCVMTTIVTRTSVL